MGIGQERFLMFTDGLMIIANPDKMMILFLKIYHLKKVKKSYSISC
jgi:hypothetical protein